MAVLSDEFEKWWKSSGWDGHQAKPIALEAWLSAKAAYRSDAEVNQPFACCEVINGVLCDLDSLSFCRDIGSGDDLTLQDMSDIAKSVAGRLRRIIDTENTKYKWVNLNQRLPVLDTVDINGVAVPLSRDFLVQDKAGGVWWASYNGSKWFGVARSPERLEKWPVADALNAAGVAAWMDLPMPAQKI